jgi:hypothetical protein
MVRGAAAQPQHSRTIPAARSAAVRPGGVLALARITQLTETEGAGDQPAVRIALRISAPGVAFDTAARVLVSPPRRANCDAGQLVVIVDPATRDFQIDWERSALVNGLVPARFSVDGTVHDLTGRAGPLVEILRILRAHDVPLHRLAGAGADPALPDELRAVIRAAGEQA